MLGPRNIFGRIISAIACCVIVPLLPWIIAASCAHSITAIDECQALVRIYLGIGELLRAIQKTKIVNGSLTGAADPVTIYYRPDPWAEAISVAGGQPSIGSVPIKSAGRRPRPCCCRFVSC